MPNGVYDIGANRGTLYVGTSYDTPEFAADSLARWWREEGVVRYPEAIELLVLPTAEEATATGNAPSGTGFSIAYAIRTASP